MQRLNGSTAQAADPPEPRLTKPHSRRKNNPRRLAGQAAGGIWPFSAVMLALVKVQAFNQVRGGLVEDLDPHEIRSAMRFLAVPQSMN
jgi:hypothetical protein